MADTDFLILGAGHNALVCAGYLAKAGYRVTVIERRHKVGGAVVTEEIVPGYKFDLGGSAHLLIQHTPVIRDLELEKHGLEYLDLDPLFFMPFPDDKSITVYRNVDQTCQSIAQAAPEDAEAYRDFIHRWMPMAEGMVDSFNHAPTPLNLARYLAIKPGMKGNMSERLSDILHPYGQVLRESFHAPYVPALMAWMAAQSGPPPTEPFSAPFALWHPMYHVGGMKRPRGGSGMLTQALANMIEAHGGTIHTDATVTRVLVEGGRAVGAETADGTRHTAKYGVVSGMHIHTLTRLLGEDAPPKMRTLVSKARIGNGFGMIVRYAVSELPRYTAAPHRTDTSIAMQFICPDIAYLERAYGDYLGGRPSSEPGLIAMTWSAADPSLAPTGKHVLFLWGQYYPYELANGEHWDAIAEREAAKMWAILQRYAPNMTEDKIVGKLIETPLYLERELGLLRGNVMHLEMSVDQMFMLRPGMGLGGYRGMLPGLWLTGASTHPGGGIMGAAGMNAAAAVLHDVTRRKRN